MQLVALAGGPLAGEVALLPVALRLRREDTRTAGNGLQKSADCEGLVANLFGRQSHARHTRQKEVVGITPLEFRGGAGRLPVGGGGDDEPVQVFHVPSAGHEFARQPIEQSRVGGSGALCTEVVRGAHQAVTEVGLPNAVNHYSRNERIVPIDQPAGKLEPVLRLQFPRGREHGRRCGGNPVAATEKVSAHVNEGVAGLGPLLHDGHRGDLARPRTLLLLELVKRRLQLLHLRATPAAAQFRTQRPAIKTHSREGAFKAIGSRFGRCVVAGTDREAAVRHGDRARHLADNPRRMIFNPIDKQPDCLVGFEHDRDIVIATIIDRPAAVDLHTLVGIGLGRHPEEKMSGHAVLVSLPTDSKNVAPLLATPVVLRSDVCDRLLGADPGGDGQVTGDAELPGVRGDVRAIPVAEQAVLAKWPGRRQSLAGDGELGLEAGPFGFEFAFRPGQPVAVLHGRSALAETLSLVLGVVEDRKEGIVIALADRIELVVVALGTIHGEAQPDAAGGIDAIGHALEAVLFHRIRLPPGLRGVAVEAGGEALLVRGTGEHVAGQLLNGELIKRHVAVEGANDPVTVGPDVAGLVVGKAPRVGIAREIEPVLRPAFGVVAGSHESIHEVCTGIRGLVLQERFEFGRGWWQSC